MEIDAAVGVGHFHGNPDRTAQADGDGGEYQPGQEPRWPGAGRAELEAVEDSVHHIGRGFAHPHRAVAEAGEVFEPEEFGTEAARDKGLWCHGGLAAGQSSFADNARQADKDDQRAQDQQQRHVEVQARQGQPRDQEDTARKEPEEGGARREDFARVALALAGQLPQAAQVSARRPQHEEGQDQQAAGLLVGDGGGSSARCPDIAAADLQADAREDELFNGVEQKEKPDAEGDVQGHQIRQAHHRQIETDRNADQTLEQDQVAGDGDFLEGLVIVVE